MKSKFIMKCLALLLIASQCTYSPLASAADLGTVLDIAGKILKGLAPPQNQHQDSNSQLPQSPILIAQSGPSSTDAVGAISSGQQEIFDPTNLQAAQKLMSRLVDAKKTIYAKNSLSPQDVYTYSAAMRPFMLYLDNYSRVKNGGNIVVMPGQTVSADLNSYCIDPMASIPGYGQKIQILPLGKLVNSRLQPLYDGLMQYSNTHEDKRAAIQGLLHHIRYTSEGNAIALQDWERSILNDAAPNGSRVWDDFQKSLSADKKTKRWQPLVDSKINDLSKWQESSELAQKVSTRASVNSNGPESALVVFVNNSDKPFVFNPSHYAALAQNQSTQRMGISGVKNVFGSNGQPIFTEEARKTAEDIVNDALSTFAGKSMVGGVKDSIGIATANPVVQDLIKSSPLVGTGIAIWELSNNEDFFTGQPLSSANKILAWASLVPGEGSLSQILGRSTLNIIEAASAASKVRELGDVLQSNTAQAIAQNIDDKLFSGQEAARSVYTALDEFSNAATTAPDISKIIRNKLVRS